MLKRSAEQERIKRNLIVLMGLSVVVRCILAATLEFGNDEVYYWTYAKYPDWSHFDHPPIVGFVIQLFSLNLLFKSEFAIRLSAIVMMTANTYIAYLIGKQIKDGKTGFVSALLFTSSVYVFILTGTFILPDTPLAFFWLLSLLMLLRYFGSNVRKTKYLLLAGLFIGLSMLSKYSGVFLWVGAGFYILFFERSELKNKWLYVSVLISFVCFLPVLIWNIDNQFVSFTFHSERVDYKGNITLLGFVRELLLEFVYNNPVLVIAAFVSVVLFFKRKNFIQKEYGRLLLAVSLPFLAAFWIFSFMRPVLPHWNSPAYMTLMFLAAPMLVGTNPLKTKTVVMFSLATLFMMVVFVFSEIQFGIVDTAEKTDENHLGKGDITLEMYGWRGLDADFDRIRQNRIEEGLMKPSDGFLCLRWHQQAHIDYYVATPLGLETYSVGTLEDEHKYLWVNEKNGGPQLHNDYWFMTESQQFIDPYENFGWRVNEIIPADTICVRRNGKTVKKVYVYMLKGLNVLPSSLRDYIKK